jgi:hypothetical protein
MASHRPSQQTSNSYHSLHLTPEELAHVPPDELLQACLEFRGLLHTLTGILYTPEISLAVRAGALDPVYAQAQRISTGQVPNETAPVVYESKQVSARLGLPPAEVRRASEALQQMGGVHMLARRLPWKREQQLPLPLDTEHADKRRE